MKILSRSTCLWLALALLIVGFASPPLRAAGAGSASLRISGTAFRPLDSAVGFGHGEGGYMYATSEPGQGWTAPVYLPQGAVVTSVRLYYYDSNASIDCTGSFAAFDFSNQGILGPWPVYSSGNAGLGYADSGPINHTIDYNKYAYILYWVPNIANNTIQLGGFQIFYTPPPGRAAVIPLN
jgi:hypothetical protein